MSLGTENTVTQRLAAGIIARAITIAWLAAWPILPAQNPTATCPKPDHAIQSGCREIRYQDLPAGAKALLDSLQCDVRPNTNYDYGSRVDLQGDGSAAYQFCCHASPHGPCGAVLIARIGNGWKDLTAAGGLLGFTGACNLFVILESRHNGFHDVCLPAQCSAAQGNCEPDIWRFDNGRYHSADH